MKYNEIYQQSEGDREREREREREELKELSKVVGEKRERDELMMMMMYNIYGSDGNMDWSTQTTDRVPVVVDYKYFLLL